MDANHFPIRKKLTFTKVLIFKSFLASDNIVGKSKIMSLCG